MTDDTHERHNALNATNFLPPSPSPAPVVTPSTPTPPRSQKIAFALSPAPQSRRGQQDSPQSVNSSTGALSTTPPKVNELNDSNGNGKRASPTIPIHYHFVSQRKQYLPPPPHPPPLERKTSIMDRPRPTRNSNPFLDLKRVSNGLSMFPPRGMLASRERTPLPNSGYAGTRGEVNRRPAAARTGDPFTSPFDDPRSPSTPASGRYPRAI